MDFDDAKENIQPLATGRNASILQASLRVDSSQELMSQRRELEREIHNYSGEDPLSVWYNYIDWIEQSYPSGGKESGLQEVLTKCLSRFESEERYYQDRRMIKLYIKFIDSHKDPSECYQQLYNAGIGTMVADFYIAWAYCYDLKGNSRKADEVFRRGIACRAQPLDELQEAHQHFGFSVAQRFIYKDDDVAKEEANRQLHERRLALASLRSHRRKAAVSSVRTGPAIKSVMPGMVQTDTASNLNRINARVNVYNDENENHNLPSIALRTEPVPLNSEAAESGKSVIRSIIDEARNRENQKEPGPWNMAHNKKRTRKLFERSALTNELGFSIHEDQNECESVADHSSIVIEGGRDIEKFNFPKNFYSTNRPQPEWNTPVTIEQTPDARTFPQYNKCMLYPRPNVEFQAEELRAYYKFRQKGIENEFTKQRDQFWRSHDITVNFRRYPNFAKSSKSQKLDSLDDFYIPPKQAGLVIAFDEIYKVESRIEYQFEEMMAANLRKRRNDTIAVETDMEETVCVPVDGMNRRKSFFPFRKSTATGTREIGTSSNIQGHVKETEIHEQLQEKCSVVEEEQKEREVRVVGIEGVNNVEKSQISKVPDTQVFQIYEDTNITENFTTDAAALSVNENQHIKPTPRPFEIFTDESVCDKFEFKAPAPPLVSQISTVKTVKMPFEIFEEGTAATTSAAASKSCVGSDDGQDNVNGRFDPEETCSTQTFNIFLKSQSVSTPKAPSKVVTRQFGTLLKDVIVPTSVASKTQGIDNETNNCVSPTVAVVASVDHNEEVSCGTTGYSPQQRKQLSTILETSEHGTTQGTHTTGTSTKSTISSPESEIDVQTLAMGATFNNVKQKSGETSASLMENVEKSIQGLRVENRSAHKEDVKVEGNPTNVLLTPATGVARLQNCGNSALESSLSENFPQPKEVGNFSRLEEREDTAGGFIVREPLRFVEDKTETISRILYTSHPDTKFQDDRTETISKILLVPPVPVKFEDDKTETLPKMPFESLKHPEHITDPVSLDDSFEFFKETPPKLQMFSNKKIHKDVLTKPAMEMSDTYKEKTTNIPLFEDELDVPVTKSSKTIFNKYSFLPPENTSLASSIKRMNVSPNAKTTMTTKKNFLKSIMHDSFLPEFSFMEDVQHPQEGSGMKVSHTENTGSISKSAIAKSSLHDSSIPKFLVIEEARSVKKNGIEVDESKQKAKQTSCITDISHNAEIENLMSISAEVKSETKLEQTKSPSQNSFNDIGSGTESKNTLKHIRMDSFVKDLSTVKEWDLTLPTLPTQPIKEGGILTKSKCSSTLKFLNDSVKQKQNSREKENSINNGLSVSITSNSGIKGPIPQTKLSFLVPSVKKLTLSPCKLSAPKGSNSLEPKTLFELNADTEMFATNISMIKNSTWLPDHSPVKKSLHNKLEDISTMSSKCSLMGSLHTSKLYFQDNVAETRGENELTNNGIGISRSHIKDSNTDLTSMKSEGQLIKSTSTIQTHPTEVAEKKDEDHEMSIYYKNTPKTPKIQVHIWEDEECETPENNKYMYPDQDLNQTHQIIENICIDPNVNPFNGDLITAFLEQINFTNYIEDLPTCKLIGRVPRLQAQLKVVVHNTEFEIVKLIGEGAYGAVYWGKEVKTGKKYAFKQERPPNFWEYYICLEIRDRLQVDEMLPAYMSIDYALIGNNSSVLISNFSQYGSLITICNKIKKHTMKNVDEYIVMLMACELLEIIDHLHAIGIIHADIKADNFLLMNKLSYAGTERTLQLIDFGVSIDMKLFKPDQTFCYVHNDNAFKCVEMREQRPWTYQLDLYGLASVLHVLLFGKYMDIEKRTNGTWMHKTHVPRYFNRTLWETIFKALLNVRDCNSMPNLQELRALLKEEIEEKEKYVSKVVAEFNKALSS